MAQQDKLTDLFLDELFKSIFFKEKILKVCLVHLKYSFIPKELPDYKYIYRSIIDQYKLTEKLPSIGAVSQQYKNNPDVQSTLVRIKEIPIVDEEILIDQLEGYIKDVEFQSVYEDLYTLYSEDKKQEAIEKMVTESSRIHAISLRKDSKGFYNLFENFEESLDKDKVEDENDLIADRVPFGIDELDSIVWGGMEEGESALIIARSGVGKSTALRHIGMHNALRGKKVLHFQLEGSEDHVRRKYNQIWTNSRFSKIRQGDLSPIQRRKAIALAKKMKAKGQDITIYTIEKFGEPSAEKLRELVLEYHKINEYFPDIILFDSLNLMITGVSKKIDYDPSFKKDRMKKCAELITNMASEFKTRTVAVTQSRDVQKEKYNDPDFVIDRNYTEGDRTLVQPFSHVWTINATDDEQKKDIIRIYIDKLRNFSTKERVLNICSNYDLGRFYDRKKTLSRFYTDVEV